MQNFLDEIEMLKIAIDTLEENKSVSTSKFTFQSLAFDDIKKHLQKASKVFEPKQFVIIEDDENYTIARLSEWVDLSNFYSTKEKELPSVKQAVGNTLTEWIDELIEETSQPYVSFAGLLTKSKKSKWSLNRLNREIDICDRLQEMTRNERRSKFEGKDRKHYWVDDMRDEELEDDQTDAQLKKSRPLTPEQIAFAEQVASERKRYNPDL